MKKFEAVFILFVICMFLLSLKVFGQTTALTEAEQLNVRNKQVATLSLLEQKRQADAKFDEAIQAAQADLSKAINEVYSTRKIAVDEYSLCDGPQAGVCAEVPKGTIALKPNPAQGTRQLKSEQKPETKK
jgi:hypothetical protein